MNFTTTWIFNARWSATHTLPIPPAPRTRDSRTDCDTMSPGRT
jgi:hypothetical protein